MHQSVPVHQHVLELDVAVHHTERMAKPRTMKNALEYHNDAFRGVHIITRAKQHLLTACLYDGHVAWWFCIEHCDEDIMSE